jgi:hypothetical protein
LKRKTYRILDQLVDSAALKIVGVIEVLNSKELLKSRTSEFCLLFELAHRTGCWHDVGGIGDSGRWSNAGRNVHAKRLTRDE